MTVRDDFAHASKRTAPLDARPLAKRGQLLAMRGGTISEVYGERIELQFGELAPQVWEPLPGTKAEWWVRVQ